MGNKTYNVGQQRLTELNNVDLSRPCVIQKIMHGDHLRLQLANLQLKAAYSPIAIGGQASQSSCKKATVDQLSNTSLASGNSKFWNLVSVNLEMRTVQREKGTHR